MRGALGERMYQALFRSYAASCVPVRAISAGSESDQSASLGALRTTSASASSQGNTPLLLLRHIRVPARLRCPFVPIMARPAACPGSLLDLATELILAADPAYRCTVTCFRKFVPSHRGPAGVAWLPEGECRAAARVLCTRARARDTLGDPCTQRLVCCLIPCRPCRGFRTLARWNCCRVSSFGRSGVCSETDDCTCAQRSTCGPSRASAAMQHRACGNPPCTGEWCCKYRLAARDGWVTARTS